MKLVIGIPDKIYSFITTECNDVTISENEAPFEYIIRGIIDGSPLPKGHGRLIDADNLKNNMEFICMDIMAGTETYNAPLIEIDNAPTIIEADKAVENE